MFLGPFFLHLIITAVSNSFLCCCNCGIFFIRWEGWGEMFFSLLSEIFKFFQVIIFSSPFRSACLFTDSSNSAWFFTSLVVVAFQTCYHNWALVKVLPQYWWPANNKNDEISKKCSHSSKKTFPSKINFFPPLPFFKNAIQSYRISIQNQIFLPLFHSYAKLSQPQNQRMLKS